MSIRMFLTLAALGAARVGLAACPSPHQTYTDPWWTEDCQNPTIVVEGGSTGTYVSGSNVHIVANGNATVRIRAHTPGLNVGAVTVTTQTPGSNIELVFMSSVNNVNSVVMGNGVGNLSLEGEITGDLGDVLATGIGVDSSSLGFSVGDDIVGDIILRDEEFAPELRIRTLAVLGDIGPNVQVDTESGGIGEITVGGAIGTVGNPVLIYSGRDITKITAGEMHVNVVAGWNDPNDSPDMGTEWANVEELRTQFDTQNGDGPVHTGNFVGSIYANTIGEPVKRLGDPEGAQSIPQIEVQGDFQGILSFESPIVPHHTFTGSQIVVGGAFKSGSVISLPASGLEGQIIFNRGNIGSSWQSNARVEVGSVDLTTTQYNPSALTIGGGAAGLAEFRLHHSACQPPDVFGNPPVSQPGVVVVPTDLVLAPDGFSWDCVPQKPSVTVQFYGPVAIKSGYEETAMKVHRYTGSGWTLVTSSFEYAAVAGGDTKRIAITPKNGWVAGSYRVTREPGALLSREVANDSSNNAAGVNAFTYYFDVVIDECELELLAGFDLNSDPAVTEPGDVPAWLVSPEDFNADATADTTDMQLLQSAAALYGVVPDAPEYFPGPYVDVE